MVNTSAVDNVEPDDVERKPQFDSQQAELIARNSFGIEGVASSLPSERDLNFKISTETEGAFVLKIANPATPPEIIELENQAIQLVSASERFSELQLFKSDARELAVKLADADGATCLVRLIRYVEGQPLAAIEEPSNDLIREIGVSLAHMDNLMGPLEHCAAAKRDLKWDLAQAPRWIQYGIENCEEPTKRQILETILNHYREIEFRLSKLDQSVIHNDANDYNVIVNGDRIAFIDFGDIVHSHTINNLAICAAYTCLGSSSPIEKVLPLIAGYDSVRSISDEEMSVLFTLILARLGQSVSISAQQQKLDPDNEYLTITQQPAWQALERLVKIEPEMARMKMADSCLERYTQSETQDGITPASELIDGRKKHLAPVLSLSYDRPLHIVRGQGQYLYNEQGAAYLDCVNNVCHVGHCHPDVVAAAVDQIRTLNTNTRYLHDNIVQYAKQLTAKFPEKLEVCFLVNSGSEANDLALRLARNFTGNHDVAAIDHAYHGHLSSLIEISPYKFDGKGGAGRQQHIHVLTAPDGYRGPFKSSQPDCGERYAELARKELATSLEQSPANPEGRLAGVIVESLLGCGGQVPLPDGYLKALYPVIRELGGICIADEVQVGFGRVGTHFWGFEKQGVVPDIVTMGKPIGNGHPLAAVVTTREIADAFHNGMEYFNTFGGNPVSCAIGSAVLKVIEKEGLQKHALKTGNWLLGEFEKLKSRYPLIGDVRGSGLFLGIELVRDHETLEPADTEAHQVVQQMRENHILLSTDGPYHNVIKFKPPMVFSQANAERLVMLLDKCFSAL